MSVRLGLRRAPDCRAESDVGRIILESQKAKVSGKSVIVPSFRNER